MIIGLPRQMRRREFITRIGVAAVAWPPAARAQQSDRMRRIGVLLPAIKDDFVFQARLGAFLQELERFGWTDGRNVQLEYRWGGGNPDDIRRYAAELVALAPDAILTSGSAPVAALQQATRTLPIVFATAADPVGAGFVDSLSRPAGNITGFALFEYSIGGKWLELLKEISPNVIRVAVLRDRAVAAGPGQFGAIQTAAPSFGIEVSPIGLRDSSEIERAITAFGRLPNGGLIVTASPLVQLHRELIITLAARHKLPALYFDRSFVAVGGLISYGADFVDQFRRAAGYVNRIFRGEKPGDLPVQAPTRYELAINTKTAKSLGLNISPGLLARADEVIE
jgi:putative ABC transport system substrate-binding protein